MFYYRKKQMWIFDDNDKQAARMVSVIDFLTRHYGFTFKQIGRIYRCQQHDSLVVKADERTWYWNSRRIGGGDVLEFVMKYDNKTYAQALEIVINPSPAAGSQARKESVGAAAEGKRTVQTGFCLSYSVALHFSANSIFLNEDGIYL